jgi:hypothetical protein
MAIRERRNGLPAAPAIATAHHGSYTQDIPLMRGTIFLYDLPDVVIPSLAGGMHHASTPLVEEDRGRFLGSHILTLRNAAMCYNSSGLLAASYVSCDRSWILRRADS